MSIGKIILSLSFTFISFSAFAQQATIGGYVKDSTEVITGASVTIKKTTTGASTDSNGYYELKGIKKGTYLLQVSYLGYLTQVISVTVKDNEKLSLSFSLKKDPRQLNDVAVTGKSKVREVKESAFTVNAIDTKAYANTTADLNQVLNRSTGIRIREQGGLGSNFNFSINGLSGKAVKYFIDGVPIELMGSSMSLNNIPVNLAERIEVYKGVVPVQLGSDAMGGAVNVITNKSVGNYLDVSDSYGSFNTHRAALTGQFIHKPTGIIVRASAFYNYSDNNYKMKDVEVLQGGTRNGMEITNLTGATFVTKDVNRFHDHYQAAMGQVEVGITDKKWADGLFAGFAYTGGDQDLQTGFEQTIVYGKVNRKSSALSGSLRYKKDNLFIKGLSLNLFASHSRDKYVTADTLLRQYYWDGYWTSKAATEMGGIKMLSNIIRPRNFGRANLSYVINDQHSININYTLDDIKNESFNELLVPADDMPGKLKKQIIGVAYQEEFFDKKMVNTFFGKSYHLGLEQKKYVSNAYRVVDTAFTNYGYGVATRYKLLNNLGVKASFERAYRLQEVEEMFGDGLNLQPNPDLKPESSNNINLGGYYGFNLQRHRIFIEASGFYRNAKDFIYPVPDQRSKALKNENKSSVRVTGFEAEVRYNYADLLAFNINATYQSAINTTKTGSTESNIPEATYLNKIPNQPWLFGNADFTIGKNNLLGKNTRLQFNWYTQYVHWFYLTWEAFGNVNGKSEVPTQLVHTASFTYSLANGRYNITAECRNLTDNLAYDNFRLQKPGRAFSVKFRYFIR